MKQNALICLIVILCGSLISNAVFAEGGRAYGGGGGHYGGGGGHYGGGHYGGGWGYGQGGHHYGHSNFGFYFGAPFYPYFPNQYPYYYPPSVITVPIPVTPPVYIQQPQPSQQYPAGYWYYCTKPEGYYPYIKVCPSGWQQVNPIPSAPH